MEDRSGIQIGIQVKKDKQHPFGWKNIDSIPPDEPCIVIFGGSKDTDEKIAHGYAKMIKTVLKKKIPIYSVSYNFDNRNFRKDREAILRKHQQGSDAFHHLHLGQITPEDILYTPRYFKEAYKKIIAPRLRDENGNRVSLEKLSQRLNMIPCVTQCFGSTFTFKMEELMAKDLQDLGYPEKFQKHILKQIHCADIAPVSPYRKSQFTHFKFVSCADEIAMSVGIPEIQYITERKKEREGNLSYQPLPYDIGNPLHLNFCIMRPTYCETVFVVNSLYDPEVYKDSDYQSVEHNLSSYIDKEDFVTKDGNVFERKISGDLLNQTIRETINWLSEHALKNQKSFQELPDIFTEKRFSRLIKLAQDNRYKTLTNEINIIKKRNGR